MSFTLFRKVQFDVSAQGIRLYVSFLNWTSRPVEPPSPSRWHCVDEQVCDDAAHGYFSRATEGWKQGMCLPQTERCHKGSILENDTSDLRPLELSQMPRSLFCIDMGTLGEETGSSIVHRFQVTTQICYNSQLKNWSSIISFRKQILWHPYRSSIFNWPNSMTSVKNTLSVSLSWATVEEATHHEPSVPLHVLVGVPSPFLRTMFVVTMRDQVAAPPPPPRKGKACLRHMQCSWRFNNTGVRGTGPPLSKIHRELLTPPKLNYK